MQLAVLGMHRSGTSALARVLNLVGCYVGGDDSFNAADEANPKGYWERRDVHRFNEDLLAVLGCDWSNVVDLDLDALSETDRARFTERRSQIVEGLQAHQPWAIKDPRLSLTFPLWREGLERPVCLIAVRNPLEVARSLQTRDDMPLLAGVGLWQLYTASALRVTDGLPRLLVSYHDVLTAPFETALRLVADLTDLGVTGLQTPSREVIEDFIDPSLYRAKSSDGEVEDWLDDRQLALWRAVRDGSALESAASGDGWKPSPQIRDLLAGLGRLNAEHRSSSLRAHELAVEIEKMKAEVEVHGPAFHRILQLEASLDERRNAFDECDRSARSLERSLGASEREREIAAGRLDEERARRELLEAHQARLEHELATLHLQQASMTKEAEMLREQLRAGEHRLQQQIDRVTAWKTDLDTVHERARHLSDATRALLDSRSLRLAERLRKAASGLRRERSIPAAARVELALAALHEHFNPVSPTEPSEDPREEE